jgi:hypothetical protein
MKIPYSKKIKGSYTYAIRMHSDDKLMGLKLFFILGIGNKWEYEFSHIFKGINVTSIHHNPGLKSKGLYLPFFNKIVLIIMKQGILIISVFLPIKFLYIYEQRRGIALQKTLVDGWPLPASGIDFLLRAVRYQKNVVIYLDAYDITNNPVYRIIGL